MEGRSYVQRGRGHALEIQMGKGIIGGENNYDVETVLCAWGGVVYRESELTSSSSSQLVVSCRELLVDPACLMGSPI